MANRKSIRLGMTPGPRQPRRPFIQLNHPRWFTLLKHTLLRRPWRLTGIDRRSGLRRRLPTPRSFAERTHDSTNAVRTLPARMVKRKLPSLRPRVRLVVDVHHVLDRELGVALRGRQALMPQQLLDGAQVRSLLQHVRAEGVTQRVRMNLGRQSLGDGDALDEAFAAARCDPDEFEAWKKFAAEPRNSPESMEKMTGVPAAKVRAAARLYAIAPNAAIYYGLGLTEHSQGSTMVLGIANLAMATGNIGRPGVAVNPLRGQNNVQGAGDMGSFPHELSGYRHISDEAVRASFDAAWGVRVDPEPGLRIPNMFDAALDGSFKGLYIQGEDVAQSEPDGRHVAAALRAMECVVLQDLFLNETAK